MKLWVSTITLSIVLAMNSSGYVHAQSSRNVYPPEVLKSYRDRADVLDAEGMRAQAAEMRAMADWQEAAGDETPEGMRRHKMLERRWRLLLLNRSINEARAAGQKNEVLQFQALIELLEAEGDDSQKGQDRTHAAQRKLLIGVQRSGADSSEREGRNEDANAIRAHAEYLEASNDTSAAGQPKLKAAQDRLGKAAMAQAISAARTEGRTKDAENLEQMGKAMLALPADRFSWTGEGVDPLAESQAMRAIEHSQAGRLEAAAQGLELACPALVKEALVDTRPAPWMRPSNSNDPGVTSARCYAELAIVQARMAGQAGGTVDSRLFETIQFATQSNASAAVSRASARNFAIGKGAGRTLEQIDRHLRELEDRAVPFFTKWTPNRLEKANEMSDSQSLEMLADAGRMYLSMRPNNEAIEKSVRDLRVRVPEYFELRIATPLSLDSLKTAGRAGETLLKPDEAIVVWLMAPGREKGLVYAVSSTQSAWAFMGLNGDDTEGRVEILRRGIDPCTYEPRNPDCGKRLRFDRHAAFELYQSLLGDARIQSVIGGAGVKTLHIVPSGALTVLPPSVLVTERPPRDTGDEVNSWSSWSETKWLIRSKALAVLPSVSSLRPLRGSPTSAAPSNKGGDLFMMADPDFDGSGKSVKISCDGRPRSGTGGMSAALMGGRIDRASLSKLKPLPCTRAEGTTLQGLIGGTLLLGTSARESQLRAPEYAARLQGAEIVAFATHGLVSGDFGIGEPALALAAPMAGERDDGVLTASEAAQLRLRADWVLLSACNTASPDANEANGLSGLARAFFFAGAKSVLVSHWRIDDEVTATLVQKTVELRRRGVSKAEALQQASLSVMRSEDLRRDAMTAPEFRDLALRRLHPALWAPFVVMGESR